MATLIAKEEFQADFMESPSTEINRDGDRVLRELNSGAWWSEMEEIKPEGSILCPLILFTDGMQAAMNDRHSIKPLKLAIGNHPLSVLNKPQAKRVSTHYLPLDNSSYLREFCVCST